MNSMNMEATMLILRLFIQALFNLTLNMFGHNKRLNRKPVIAFLKTANHIVNYSISPTAIS
jgi:hypothetical protein